MSLSTLRPSLASHVEGESAEAFSTRLALLSATLADTAEHYDESGAFPHDNFRLLHEHGLLALTVPTALGGAGVDLVRAQQVISAVAKGEPSTALILVMQYLQHSRLQDSKSWLMICADGLPKTQCVMAR